jgi:hypothetical protein
MYYLAKHYTQRSVYEKKELRKEEIKEIFKIHEEEIKNLWAYMAKIYDVLQKIGNIAQKATSKMTSR